MPPHGCPLFTISRVVQACDDMLGEGSKWPERTDRACLWCTESFPWVPVGVPRSYNERKDIFTLKWAFCSFNCAKAYMCDKGMKTDLLFYMAQRLFGGSHDKAARLSGIREAPARESLRKFGGPLDIEQFRGTPLRIREGHPLDINVQCDPHLLTVTGGGAEDTVPMAMPSRAARAATLLQPPVVPTPTRLVPERTGGGVSQMMRRATAPAKPVAKRGLDAFLRPTGAAPRQQLADSQAARPGKRVKA